MEELCILGVLVFSLDILLGHWVCRVSFWPPHLSPVLGKILTPFHVFSKLLSLSFQYRCSPRRENFHISHFEGGYWKVCGQPETESDADALLGRAQSYDAARRWAQNWRPAPNFPLLPTYLPTYLPTHLLNTYKISKPIPWNWTDTCDLFLLNTYVVPSDLPTNLAFLSTLGFLNTLWIISYSKFVLVFC